MSSHQDTHTSFLIPHYSPLGYVVYQRGRLAPPYWQGKVNRISMTTMTPLEEAVEFAENPEPRCPCVLLLDTSGSMHGAAIAALNQGLQTFRDDLAKDPLASRRVE